MRAKMPGVTMDQPPEATALAAAPGTSGWSRDLAILGAAAIAIFAAIGWHPIIGSAMRYAESAREMVHSSDWVVPTLNYVPYFEKPILTYWLGALTQLLFGSSPWAVQLPSLIAGLVSLTATYALGRFWRDARFGLLAALLLLFSGQFLVFTTIFNTDPLLSACLAVCWYAYFRHHQSAPCRWHDLLAPQLRWLWLFWLALACAFLTKGPLAIVLSGCAIGGYALLSAGPLGVWRELMRLRPVSGLLIMAAVCLPWHLLVWQRDPRFLEYFYWHINVEAFFDGSINHPGPPWYYLPIIAAALAPWTFIGVPLLVLALARALGPLVTRLRDRLDRSGAPGAPAETGGPSAGEPGRYRDGQLYLACVLLFPLIFLSISASKLGTYAMPLFPALALLVADQLTRLEARPPAWLRFGLPVQIILLIVAGVVYITVLAKPDAFRQVDWAWWPVLALALMALIGTGIWGAVRTGRGAIRSGMAIVAVGMAVAIAIALPNAFHVLKYIDGRALARTAEVFLAPGDDILLTPACVHDHSLVWQLDRPLNILGDPRELDMGLYTAATKPGSPWPLMHDEQGRAVINPRNGSPRTQDLYKLSREDAPGQARLWTRDELSHEWRGSGRIWLFGDAGWIAPLLDQHLAVYEVARTDKITLVTNQPVAGLTSGPLTSYRHGLQ